MLSIGFYGFLSVFVPKCVELYRVVPISTKFFRVASVPRSGRLAAAAISGVNHRRASLIALIKSLLGPSAFGPPVDVIGMKSRTGVFLVHAGLVAPSAV